MEEENLKLKNDIRELTDLEEAPIMPLPDVPRASETRIEMIDAAAIVGSAITAEQLMGSGVFRYKREYDRSFFVGVRCRTGITKKTKET